MRQLVSSSKGGPAAAPDRKLPPQLPVSLWKYPASHRTPQLGGCWAAAVTQTLKITRANTFYYCVHVTCGETSCSRSRLTLHNAPQDTLRKMFSRTRRQTAHLPRQRTCRLDILVVERGRVAPSQKQLKPSGDVRVLARRAERTKLVGPQSPVEQRALETNRAAQQQCFLKAFPSLLLTVTGSGEAQHILSR